MPDLHDERRQEPRFRTAGSASFSVGRKEFRALVLDLSLNGLKLTRPEGFAATKGQRFPITLSIPGTDPFKAEVMIVHVEPAQLGVEFFDMPPRDFGVLAGLIEQFVRLKRRANPAA
jgi:hypothetical protein